MMRERKLRREKRGVRRVEERGWKERERVRQGGYLISSLAQGDRPRRGAQGE